jgi:hypothetical protein
LRHDNEDKSSGFGFLAFDDMKKGKLQRNEENRRM